MRWVVPVVIGVALLAIAYLLLFPRNGGRDDDTGRGAITATQTGGPRTDASSGTSGPGTPAPIAGATTSAAVLDSAFFSDPVDAALRYAGPVRVTGVIATMVQPGATPSLSMEGRTRFNYIVVNFPEGYRAQLAPLMKGQTISVACQNARSVGGTTILSECLLV